jgi:hypothetical protein
MGIGCEIREEEGHTAAPAAEGKAQKSMGSVEVVEERKGG